MKSIQFLILILIFTTTNIFALEKLEDKNNVMKESQSVGSDDNEENSEEDEPKTIESFIEENGLEEIDGFMHIWVDKEKEDYFLQLNIADLNEEFIYFTQPCINCELYHYTAFHRRAFTVVRKSHCVVRVWWRWRI